MSGHITYTPEGWDGMGRWKKKQVEKKGKRSYTKSSIGKPYIAIPPVGGWPPFTGNYSEQGVRMGKR